MEASQERKKERTKKKKTQNKEKKKEKSLRCDEWMMKKQRRKNSGVQEDPCSRGEVAAQCVFRVCVCVRGSLTKLSQAKGVPLSLFTSSALSLSLSLC